MTSSRADTYRANLQKTALEKTTEHFEKHSRCQVRWACGIGKTKFGHDVHKALNSKFTIVVAPTRDLLVQTHAEWRKWGSQADHLIFASIQKRKPGVENVITTLKKDKLLSTLQSNKSVVVFTTYRSLDRFAKHLRDPDSKLRGADLTIFDEAHRSAGAQDKKYAVGLSSEKLPSNKRLFLTATPVIYAGDSGDLDIFNSMDDTDVYGDVVHSVSFKEAVNGDILCPVKVIIANVDRENYQKPSGMDEKHFLPAIAVSKAVVSHDLMTGLSFHNTTDAAKKFATAVNQLSRKVSDIQIEAISADASVSPNLRQSIITRLKNPIRATLVSNCRLFAEGIDVPNLDHVTIVDEKSSTINLIQIVGRVMRKADALKKCGYIVIPVAINSKGEIYHSGLETIKNVIDVLASHDESVSSLIENLSREVGPEKRKRTIELLLNYFDLQCSDEIAKKIFEAISTQMYQPKSNEVWLEELKGYVDKGDWAPHQSRLATWITRMRRNNPMMSEKIQGLLDRLINDQALITFKDAASRLEITPQKLSRLSLHRGFKSQRIFYETYIKKSDYDVIALHVNVPSGFVKIDEAARRLNLSKDAIIYRVKKKKIPKKKIGGVLYVDYDQLVKAEFEAAEEIRDLVSITDAAATLGFSKGHLTKILRENKEHFTIVERGVGYFVSVQEIADYFEKYGKKKRA